MKGRYEKCNSNFDFGIKIMSCSSKRSAGGTEISDQPDWVQSMGLKMEAKEQLEA